MNSKLIIYLMAGVGVIFMGIVVAYVILSKKLKASDTMQIKQLREGTQEKSFSFEILYQKLYTMYIKNPFTKRYLFKIRRRLEIINIDDEYLTRKQTAQILTRTLLLVIPITIAIIWLTHKNYLLLSILLIFEVFIFLIKLLFHKEISAHIELSTFGTSNKAVLIESMTGSCGL